MKIPSGFTKLSLAVDFLMPGTVIKSPLFDKKGNKLLEAKTPFTSDIIQNFKNSNIDKVYYYQQYSEEFENYLQAEKTDPKVTKNIHFLDPKIIHLAENITQDIENSIKKGSFIQMTGVHQLIEILLKIIWRFNKIPRMLINEKSRNNNFCDHALNVSILSMISAIQHGFENPLIKQIGIGAFLHDIGKFKIPKSILDKEHGYTPEEIQELKKHATYGFELIKLNGQLTGTIRKIILLHHEGADGSGYPLGLKEKDVGYYPYIVSLANIFDNLTTIKNYRPAYTLKDTLSMLIQTSGKKLPPYLVQNFIKHISNSQPPSFRFTIGKFVLLNTQEIAQISKTNTDNPSKPVIRIIRNEDGKTIEPPLIVNLKNDTLRKISKELNQELQQQLLRRYPYKK